MSTVKVTITPELECKKCDEVLLWLNNPLLLDANVGLPVEDYRYFLRGEIVDVTMISSGVFEYTIEYDETLLTDPDGGITYQDIKQVCCLGCLYEWLQGEALCELLQGAPSDCFDGISLLSLSADLGTTELLVGGDEIRVFGGASITSTASNPDTVTLDLVLSGDVDQILSFGTDGNIYLDCPTVLGCINVQNPITGDGSAGSPFGIAISADAGNDLELRLDGLYAADTQLSCTDVRNCLFKINPISGTGSGADPLKIDISADAFNQLELRVDGLYVPNVDTTLTCPQVLACINVENPIHGDGSVGTPFGIDLSADVGNVLELRVDGLYVPDVDCTTVLACINVANPISGDGSGGNPFTVDISANAGNDLSLVGDGLYVPEETLTGFAPGGTTPIGSRIQNYTAEDGSVDGIVTGIYDLHASSEIGPQYMVKEVDIIPSPTVNYLKIVSAPEISHDAGLNGFNDVNPIPLDVVGTFVGSEKGPYVFVNPWSNRRAAIIPYENIGGGWRKLAGNTNLAFDMFYERRYNGAGPWSLAGTALFEDYDNSRVADIHNFNTSFMDLTNGPLDPAPAPPGDRIILSIRLGATVHIAGPAGSNIYSHAGSVGVQFFGTY